MKQLFVVKIGGHVIDDQQRLQRFLHDFAGLPGHKILVHGGGKIATETGKRMGLESVYVAGRRVTDADTLRLVTMVYGGLVNKEIVALLQAAGANAIGLTGADGNLMKAVKRPVAGIDYGYVGDIQQGGVNTGLLSVLTENNMLPVLAPLTHDGEGSMLNTNADTIASEIAIALSEQYEVSLYYCFEKKGVLRSISDENSVITDIDRTSYDKLIEEGIIADGMLPKLHNCFHALENKVQHVYVGSIAMLANPNEQKTTLHLNEFN